MNLINMMINMIKTKLLTLQYWINWGPHYVWFRRLSWKFEINVIEYKLRRKGFSWDKTMGIMERYVRMAQYKNSVITRENTRIIYDAIVKASEKTGVPQWEIRASIEENFNIKV